MQSAEARLFVHSIKGIKQDVLGEEPVLCSLWMMHVIAVKNIVVWMSSKDDKQGNHSAVQVVDSEF